MSAWKIAAIAFAAAFVVLSACVLVSCTAAEDTTIAADFATACDDWNGAKTLVELASSPVPYADTIEAYVSDACDLGSALAKSPTSDDVAWLRQSTENLKTAVASAK